MAVTSATVGYARPMTHGGIESEIKLPVADLNKVRRRLERDGAKLVHAAAHEDNLLLDTSSGRLQARDSVLRVRQARGRTLLTLKGPASFHDRVKQRSEHELEVVDGGCLLAILRGLGFDIVARYQKEREAWRLGETDVLLDRTPMGNFVEIEGPLELVSASARRLGLDAESAVTESYLELWRDYRRSRPGDELPEDMLFTT
jgi:adenylate cyclase class 2